MSNDCKWFHSIMWRHCFYYSIFAIHEHRNEVKGAISTLSDKSLMCLRNSSCTCMLSLMKGWEVYRIRWLRVRLISTWRKILPCHYNAAHQLFDAFFVETITHSTVHIVHNVQNRVWSKNFVWNIAWQQNTAFILQYGCDESWHDT